MMSDARQPEENVFFLFFKRCFVATKFVWLSLISLLLQNHFVIQPCSHTIYFLFETRPARLTIKTAEECFFLAQSLNKCNPERSNKKLLSQFSFKTSQSGLEVFLFGWVILMKNLQQRQTVAKLRSENHDLRIETGKHSVQKFLKTLGYVNVVHLMYVKNERNGLQIVSTMAQEKNSVVILLLDIRALLIQCNRENIVSFPLQTNLFVAICFKKTKFQRRKIKTS